MNKKYQGYAKLIT